MHVHAVIILNVTLTDFTPLPLSPSSGEDLGLKCAEIVFRYHSAQKQDFIELEFTLMLHTAEAVVVK